MTNRIIRILISTPAVLIAVVLHELAHGYASAKLGDPTPEATGRLTLNPFAHLDLVGVVSFMVFGFGWAKPVQVDPRYYRHRGRGMAIVALAGPLVNFLLAFAAYFTMALVLRLWGGALGAGQYYFVIFLQLLASINLTLGVFNLLPIPPLDGSRIVGAALPPAVQRLLRRAERYGNFIVIAFLMLGGSRLIAALSGAVGDIFIDLVIRLTGY